MEKYIIPAFLAFIVGLVLWFIKRDRLSLEYTITESEIFPKGSVQGKYFLLNLKNNGNKALENINYQLELNLGKIDSLQFSKKDLIDINQQSDKTIKGLIALLNPNEELRTTLTIENAEDYSKIKIQARGVGVTAIESKKNQLPFYLQSFLIPFSIVIVASTAYTAFTSFNQIKVNESINSINDIKNITKDIKENNTIINTELFDYKSKLTEQSEKLSLLIKENETRLKQEALGKPDREQIIFASLNKAGLSFLLPQLLENTGDNLPYWKTGLFLVNSYLIDKKNSTKYVNVLESLANIKDISPSSKGFLFYLAGKIEKNEQHTERAILYFNKCKANTPLMYEYLIEQDPAYNLNSIEEWLIKNQKAI